MPSDPSNHPLSQEEFRKYIDPITHLLGINAVAAVAGEIVIATQSGEELRLGVDAAATMVIGLIATRTEVFVCPGISEYRRGRDPRVTLRHKFISACKGYLEHAALCQQAPPAPKIPESVTDARTLNAVADELQRARKLHAPMGSPHEAYAVILEEVDEFWSEVKLRPDVQDHGAMRSELIQIAAMACRAVADLRLAEATGGRG